MSILQTDRLVRIATNLGEDAFVVRSFSGFEKISGLFSFNLALASERSDITFAELAGKNTTLSIGSSDGDQRFFNGISSPALTPAKARTGKDSANIWPLSGQPPGC